MKKRCAVISLVLVVCTWLFLTAFAWCKPADEFSDTERRKLARMPDVSILSIASGRFASGFESYTVDQFPLRDGFRRIKTYAALYLFGHADSNDLYHADGHTAKIAYPLNARSIASATKKFGYLYETYLQDAANIYVTVVPDKGYFLAEENGYPALDYDEMTTLVQEQMPWANRIDVADTLNLDSYYRTDPHWRQEAILPAAQRIAGAMGAEAMSDGEERLLIEDFYGVYAGQLPLAYDGEDIRILENETTKNAVVTTIESGVMDGIYNMAKLESRDPYETYLSGATALVTIENPLAEEKRELIVFRDSFAGPLIPLMMESYSKITLIDTRYINPNMLADHAQFEDADVLFIYSTLILNDSTTLR